MDGGKTNDCGDITKRRRSSRKPHPRQVQEAVVDLGVGRRKPAAKKRPATKSRSRSRSKSKTSKDQQLLNLVKEFVRKASSVMSSKSKKPRPKKHVHGKKCNCSCKTRGLRPAPTPRSLEGETSDEEEGAGRRKPKRPKRSA